MVMDSLMNQATAQSSLEKDGGPPFEKEESGGLQEDIGYAQQLILCTISNTENHLSLQKFAKA